MSPIVGLILQYWGIIIQHKSYARRPPQSLRAVEPFLPRGFVSTMSNLGSWGPRSLGPEFCVLDPVFCGLDHVVCVFDPEFCVLDPVFCVLDPVVSVFDPGFCVLDPVFCVLDPVFSVLDPEFDLPPVFGSGSTIKGGPHWTGKGSKEDQKRSLEVTMSKVVTVVKGGDRRSNWVTWGHRGSKEVT